jgi:hypothetical protein
MLVSNKLEEKVNCFSKFRNKINSLMLVGLFGLSLYSGIACGKTATQENNAPTINLASETDWAYSINSKIPISYDVNDKEDKENVFVKCYLNNEKLIHSSFGSDSFDFNPLEKGINEDGSYLINSIVYDSEGETGEDSMIVNVLDDRPNLIKSSVEPSEISYGEIVTYTITGKNLYDLDKIISTGTVFPGGVSYPLLEDENGTRYPEPFTYPFADVNKFGIYGANLSITHNPSLCLEDAVCTKDFPICFANIDRRGPEGIDIAVEFRGPGPDSDPVNGDVGLVDVIYKYCGNGNVDSSEINVNNDLSYLLIYDAPGPPKIDYRMDTSESGSSVYFLE